MSSLLKKYLSRQVSGVFAIQLKQTHEAANGMRKICASGFAVDDFQFAIPAYELQ
jgi:hypothetical protein